LAEQLAERLDVLHGMLDDVHLGELPVRQGGRNRASQGIKALVDGEDTVALARVSLHSLEVLGRSNGVAVHRMQRHQLLSGSHALDGLLYEHKKVLLLSEFKPN
jgi:hypothetical protein